MQNVAKNVRHGKNVARKKVEWKIIPSSTKVEITMKQMALTIPLFCSKLMGAWFIFTRCTQYHFIELSQFSLDVLVGPTKTSNNNNSVRIAARYNHRNRNDYNTHVCIYAGVCVVLNKTRFTEKRGKWDSFEEYPVISREVQEEAAECLLAVYSIRSVARVRLIWTKASENRNPTRSPKNNSLWQPQRKYLFGTRFWLAS